MLCTFESANEYINGFREITSDDVCNFHLRFKSHNYNKRFRNDIIAWVSKTLQRLLYSFLFNKCKERYFRIQCDRERERERERE